MTPLFTLYKVENIDSITLDASTSERMKNIFSLERRKDIYNALKWVELNPNFEFGRIMKDAPVNKTLKFSNEEVFNYLMRYKEYMENEDYSLLTDDRATNSPWEK